MMSTFANPTLSWLVIKDLLLYCRALGIPISMYTVLFAVSV